MRYTIIILIAFFLSGCGPGVKDGTVEIAAEYYFAFAGGEQNFIIYEGGERSKGVIISASLSQFLLVDNVIYASRKPLISEVIDDVLKVVGKGECEYYFINTLDHTVDGPLNVHQVAKSKNWEKVNVELDIQKPVIMSSECSLKSARI
ncbi:hypothetical protein [Pseudoalteromonas luteoviolacea]|uniref:Uncharacterized protein n=1 Tax=Pseudoalteromonas luteoviolacea S4054 TaxID=1129367 RepID=A0A0F6AIA9_9GAMM|nr:hypothetical protein [Pseudoalteromonas luteoviolacea]AOT07720.1 hypothetical protein S4054249_07615 [Pseudoalteromonas luteoviolacea]AOT12636.1 hypothetical protein S40542_07615 [Pseudoalteromonas luteoviolacea]AOT17550.1 hypothetical protein S4054_07615 [Pseudoalteromonas luteoviolacea]KKE85174.1 hypothetical protein N479_26190 [Pseudoalteromonas luteoviolacea S4054]KZN75482.1 hypothetical protein N481_26515 [Pseudoalteromonas luteoviolacea S4047-1]